MNKLHHEAIKCSQKAFIALQHNKKAEAIQLYRSVYDLEKKVAMNMVTQYTKEPTRSLIFKSAALLAKKGELYQEAERMACFGLTGEPSKEIAAELRLILDSVRDFLVEDLVAA